MSNMGYLDARPFVTAGYQGGQNALNNALEPEHTKDRLMLVLMICRLVP